MKIVKRTLTALALMMLLAALGASSALAIEPTGEFAVFKNCPKTVTGVNLCFYSQVTSGEVTLNKQTVPINADTKHPITLQGGIIFNEETEVETFVAASSGDTLSKTPQNVPGGLAGLINCTEIKGSGLLEVLARAACKAAFESGPTAVNAITELAKPPSSITISKANLVNREGTALGLPVKVKLENPLLGGACYIGSSTSPLQLNLTTGTTSPNPPNSPISGEVGEIEFRHEFEIVEVKQSKLVNNEFSAPGATGCGGIFAILLDPIINSKIGLPSANGKNTAIQFANTEEATPGAVKRSEE